MFDLELAIANWRKELQNAGVQSPATLRELEGHLREEIQAQVKSGNSQRNAFELAIAEIGQPKQLQTEFVKTVPAGQRFPLASRILAALWTAGCLVSLNTVCRQFASPAFNENFPNTALFYFNVIATFIYLVGATGGVLLFFGARTGARILRLIALFFVIVCVVQVLEFRAMLVWRLWCLAVAVFSLITIGVLHQHLKAARQPESRMP